jgi:hypothetical protein
MLVDTRRAHNAIRVPILADEYILHMQHHLDLILRRDRVTKYPRE